LTTIGQKLHRGYLLTIDYGYNSDRYYNIGRTTGTLQCYYQHAYHNDPYINIGHQDLTAHVNFTALENHGQNIGLINLYLTKQGLFLMALGLGDRLANISQSNLSINQLLERRQHLHQLIDPTGLGNFGVLLQGKNLGDRLANHPLKGFTFPQ
jgi:SAM-dependent MidA family methyltransferase